MIVPDEQWIVIPKWDEFQHPDALRTGNIPWVKTFTRLLSDDAYLALTAGERAVLHGIWLEYARSRGQLPLRPGSLTRRLNIKVRKEHITSLNHAGFIHISASRPASTTASRPASTEEKRRERTSSSNPKPARATPPERPYRCTGHTESCRLHFKTQRELREHLTNVHWLEHDQLEHALTEGTP